jgi:hypothetical protein
MKTIEQGEHAKGPGPFAKTITIESMQAAVCRYMVARGHHMPEAWRAFLVAECGLIEHPLVQHLMVPQEKGA